MMKNFNQKKKETARVIAFCIIALVFSLQTAGAEIVKLKGDGLVRGKILKQNSKTVIIDLGFDIIKIPRNEILSISANDKKGHQPAEKNISKNRLFLSKNMSRVTTAEGVQNFAESVVLVRTPGGLGSGFLINDKGYVITNFHVIKGQKHVSITRYKKTSAELKRIIHKKVSIVALDPFHDLAVLRIDEKVKDKLIPAVFAPQESVAVGEKVFVIGNPLGLERTVTEGVVSHAGRNFAGKVFLQIDASVNPGNSGGPLFNSFGQIIGVVNMGAKRFQGLNFAIPIRHVKFLLNNLEAFAYNETNSQSGYIYSPAPNNPSK
jgi:serine protease Do